MVSGVVLLVVLYVFFFKQKTAYEMRISDWSSDVCSSDLVDIMGGIIGARWQREDQLHLTLRFIGEVERRAANDIAEALATVRHPAFKIGRASCRERVCQYV